MAEELCEGQLEQHSKHSEGYRKVVQLNFKEQSLPNDDSVAYHLLTHHRSHGNTRLTLHWNHELICVLINHWQPFMSITILHGNVLWLKLKLNAL